jgi:hypothetical protein
MNRDRHLTHDRRPYRLRLPATGQRPGAAADRLDPDDIAPWVIAAVRAWPRSVEDRLVAVRTGISLHYVQRVRRTRP